jgi:hypothetical protein
MNTKKKKEAFSEEVNDTLDLATSTLTGDIRDVLIDFAKHLQKPWSCHVRKRAARPDRALPECRP